MKIARHAQIIKLINQYDIETQEELAKKLEESGFAVTQATISRDIRQLKLTKVPKENGGSRYAVLQNAPSEVGSRYARVLKDAFISVDLAKNILVIKTVSGMAMAAAAAFDEMNWNEIVGCIGGDDTILCVARDDDAALVAAERLKKWWTAWRRRAKSSKERTSLQKRQKMTAGVTPEEKNAHKLTRKNLALIDEAEVEFGPGLNILTGETGAGKSILIGSINAALGKKISREMIRTGETSALVELVFETENPHVLELLKETDLEAEEGQVIISRKITGSRSVCRINGEACNISQVKALASLLLDIHGQHEHQSLLYPDRQIAILDAFAGTEAATAKERSGRCTRSGRMSERSSRRTNSTRRQESGRQHFLRLKSTRLIRQS